MNPGSRLPCARLVRTSCAGDRSPKSVRSAGVRSRSVQAAGLCTSAACVSAGLGRSSDGRLAAKSRICVIERFDRLLSALL